MGVGGEFGAFVVSTWLYVQLGSVWLLSGWVEFCQMYTYGFESVSILYVSDVYRLDDHGNYGCLQCHTVNTDLTFCSRYHSLQYVLHVAFIIQPINCCHFFIFVGISVVLKTANIRLHKILIQNTSCTMHLCFTMIIKPATAYEDMEFITFETF